MITFHLEPREHEHERATIKIKQSDYNAAVIEFELCVIK